MRREAHAFHRPAPADRGLPPGRGRGADHSRPPRPGHYPPYLPGAGQRHGAGAVRPADPALRHGLSGEGGGAVNCGLIGYPLGHSYSPQIHRALADYDYRLWPLKPEELEAFLVKRDFAGINVTIPYKERVIPYLDQLSDTARAIGAVNTVVNRDGRLYGDNTDLAGMLALIRRMGLVLSGKKVLILGTGGTSKTARAAASQLGAAEVYRVSRSGRDGAVTYRQAAEEHGDAACIINTTPCGMYPDLGGCPVELDSFPCLEGVVDVIYNPLRSELVLGARQRGIPAEGGLYMLAAQAAYASALFRGCEATAGDIELAYRTVLRRMENIVLIGMPSSGKTTVGRLLAQRTGKEFVDTDALVEQAVGMPVPDYFAAKGESAFREREKEAVASAAASGGKVIATGGGAILRPENLRALRRTGRLVFLDRSPDKLTATADRPLSADPEALRRRYEERYDIYCAAADLRVNGDGSPEDTAERIEKEWTI
ncbi:MAG TPA: shikimate dehydrogenase [Oscillibacter sp.]|nr:shikimate dehydrogenase [Oscillibacter sp.]